MLKYESLVSITPNVLSTLRKGLLEGLYQEKLQVSVRFLGCYQLIMITFW